MQKPHLINKAEENQSGSGSKYMTLIGASMELGQD